MMVLMRNASNAIELAQRVQTVLFVLHVYPQRQRGVEHSALVRQVII